MRELKGAQAPLFFVPTSFRVCIGVPGKRGRSKDAWRGTMQQKSRST